MIDGRILSSVLDGQTQQSDGHVGPKYHAYEDGVRVHNRQP